MTDAKPLPSREERLAANLRENLKRRKTQARALGDTGQGEAESQPDSADTQESGLSKTAG